VNPAAAFGTTFPAAAFGTTLVAAAPERA